MNQQMVYDMQRVAMAMSNAATAMIELEGMKAENAQRAIEGNSPSYINKDFQDIIENNSLGCNDAHTVIHGEHRS